MRIRFDWANGVIVVSGKEVRELDDLLDRRRFQLDGRCRGMKWDMYPLIRSGTWGISIPIKWKGVLFEEVRRLVKN